jgi:flagellar biogenesis protein FliO
MRQHQELIFILTGLLLLLIIVGFIIYGINFLVQNIEQALNQESTQNKEIVRFNLEGLKKLGIIKEGQ